MENDRKWSGQVRNAFEILAVVGPIVCLVDCIVIPLVLALLPFVGMGHVYHGLIDQVLACVVVSICSPILVAGFINHRKKRVLAMMFLGFTLIFWSNFVGQTFDQLVHAAITLTGSILLIKANADNKRLSKCACHNHG